MEIEQTKDNQCDIQGLYGLKWSDGQTFNIRSTILGGKLQALFEIRAGTGYPTMWQANCSPIRQAS